MRFPSGSLLAESWSAASNLDNRGGSSLCWPASSPFPPRRSSCAMPRTIRSTGPWEAARPTIASGGSWERRPSPDFWPRARSSRRNGCSRRPTWSTRPKTLSFIIGGQTYQVDRKIVYPGWNGDLWSGYDIGLVHLVKPVDNIKPAQLYTGSRRIEPDRYGGWFWQDGHRRFRRHEERRPEARRPERHQPDRKQAAAGGRFRQTAAARRGPVGLLRMPCPWKA